MPYSTPVDFDCFFAVTEAEYHVNWIVDNLPSAAAVNDMDEHTQTTFYDVGFPVKYFDFDMFLHGSKYEGAFPVFLGWSSVAWPYTFE